MVKMKDSVVCVSAASRYTYRYRTICHHFVLIFSVTQHVTTVSRNIWENAMDLQFMVPGEVKKQRLRPVCRCFVLSTRTVYQCFLVLICKTYLMLITLHWHMHVVLDYDYAAGACWELFLQMLAGHCLRFFQIWKTSEHSKWQLTTSDELP